MNFIHRTVMRRAEKVLLPFRHSNILQTPMFAKYAQYLPIIQSCYKSAGYWHGTGRYQYAHGDSRYTPIDFEKHTDVFVGILQQRGLLPHHEPWLEKMQGITIATISLAPLRIYGRLYAGLYLYEKDTLTYQFGTTKFWFRLLSKLQFLDKSFIWFLLTRGLFKLARPSTFRDIKKYVHSIRKDPGRNASLFRGHLLHTDIPGNYPILVGIRHNIETINFNKGMQRFEARTDKPIQLQDITHIEVPLKNMQETENLLKEKGVSLTVIPMEFGEVYCSGLGVEELVGIR